VQKIKTSTLKTIKLRYLSNCVTDIHNIWSEEARRVFLPKWPLKVSNFQNSTVSKNLQQADPVRRITTHLLVTLSRLHWLHAVKPKTLGAGRVLKHMQAYSNAAVHTEVYKFQFAKVR